MAMSAEMLRETLLWCTLILVPLLALSLMA